MAEILPFRALRYNPKKVGDLSKVMAPPYDILSPGDQDFYYNRHSNNIVKLDFGKEMAGDGEGRNKYSRAATLLRLWSEQDILHKDEKPGLYVASQDYEAPDKKKKRFLGLISLLKLEQYKSRVVLPHEKTLSKPKADRLDLTRATHANLSQIFMLFDDPKAAGQKWLEARTKAKPAADFKTVDGVRHRLWPVFDKAVISAFQKSLKKQAVYIADGHHRYETMLAFQKEMGKRGGPKAPWPYTMVCLAPMQSPGLLVLPTHRLLFGLAKFQPQALKAGLAKNFDLEACAGLEALEAGMKKASAKGRKNFGLSLPDGVTLLTLKAGVKPASLVTEKRSEAYKNLDVAILQSAILEGLLHMTPETIAAQQNLRYTKSAHQAVDSVKRGENQAAFLLNPTPIEGVRDVSDAADVMPQKSTYFLPKLLTGLVVRKME
jgi:uncharacterized protein (DUF1015 family)